MMEYYGSDDGGLQRLDGGRLRADLGLSPSPDRYNLFWEMSQAKYRVF